MKTNIKTMLLALAVAGLSQSVSAATLTEAVEQAILRNPEVLASWHEFKATTSEIDAAKGGYLPRVDISGYLGHEWRDYPLTGNQDFDQHNAQIELRQMLFDGFATRSAVRQASYINQTRYYELLAASDRIGHEASRAYLDVLRYQKLASLARDNWATHKELHDQIEQKVKAGVGRRVDLEQASGRLALAESNWITEASNLHDVSARYERLVGSLPPDSLATPASLVKDLPKDTEALNLALNQNPNFLAAVANLRAQRARMESFKSNNYPRFELRAAQSYNRNEDGIRGDYYKGIVQLGMSYNLYRGGADSARVKAAGENLNAAFDLRDKACRDVRQETRIAQNDVKKLVEQIRQLDQHQLSTEKSRNAYRQQFDIGQRTLLDLLDTENELFESRRALTNAEVDYQLAQVRVLTHTHQLLPALKLSPLQAALSEDDLGGAEADDARIACTSDVAPKVDLVRPAIAPVAVKEEVRMVAPANVAFNFDKADIKPEFTPVLDKMAGTIGEYPGSQVKVEGHTDSKGTAAYNQKLSEKRAQNVRGYLVDKGVAADRIEAKGYGLSKPVADNATEEGRAKNRRVEVVIIPAAK